MKAKKPYWDAVTDRVAALCKENEKSVLMIAIDGKSGSGKTTLAAMLKERFGGSVLHMDDFFLRPQQRTKERLEEIGGNVDYERVKEVLLRIRKGMGIYYQVYDCKRQQLQEALWREPVRLNIVEGAYSMHPYFENIYDLRIGMEIDEQTQKKRILYRSGAAMLERFETEWIPKENAYLEKFKIFSQCEIVVNNSSVFI